MPKLETSRIAILLLAVLPLAHVACSGPPPETAPSSQICGSVMSDSNGLEGYSVKMYTSAAKQAIGSSEPTQHDGSYCVPYTPPAETDAVYFLLADHTAAPDVFITLASVLGTAADLPSQAVINERTTIAAAYSLARFYGTGLFSGPSPGLQNAALMVRNLVQPANGGLSPVLETPPNLDTDTRRTFNSLSNMLAACIANAGDCTELFKSATPPGASTPENSLTALVNVVVFPADVDVEGLYDVSTQPPAPYEPALPQAPVAWTLALRFHGNGVSMNGPGNFAIDPEGSLWVANNYQFRERQSEPACESKVLLRFTPDGQYYPHSPYRDEGFSGAGFGIDIDPYGTVWVGNFGFAGQGCTRTPTHNTVSAIDSATLEINTYDAGDISWPQGTVSDDVGNIWIANCGNDSVTVYPGGSPSKAVNLTEELGGLKKPFDIAWDKRGLHYITGTQSSSVAILDTNSHPTAESPLSGHGIDHPMGIAADSLGNMWVSNSRIVDLPCDNPKANFPEHLEGSLTLIEDRGRKLTGPLEGGGLTIPWGITVDGNDNVWVANFGGRRLSHFCGVTGKGCPAGKDTPGAAISPDEGYPFDGLVRNTGVAVDPSGNVWLANNWQEDPNLANPGGRQIVVFLGLAEPVVRPPYKPRPAAPEPASE